ncbi:MAG: FAD-binding protein, partial [Bdellovibrio sp.]|nr:FAD-binding protein [Bdellovibrio sp.]
MSEDLNPIKWFWKHIPNFSGELLFEETLYKHTFYRVGGPARVLAIPKTLEDLKLISEGIEITKIPTTVLGFGSNILVSDNGYDGLVIKTTKLNLEVSAREEEGKFIVKTGASLPLSVLLRNAIQGGWGGLEFLAG